MASKRPANVLLMGAAARALRDDFLGWQCRLRQLAARQAGARPIPGMRPRVLTPAGELLSPGIIVLIVEAEPADSIALFRHQYQKTNDPIERYDKIVEILSGGYFQKPDAFSDVLTALFGGDSALAGQLLAHGRCVLEFEQSSQAYRLPCGVTELAAKDEFHQATYWHNRMFNPNMPPNVRVLAFAPDWTHAEECRVEED